MARGRGSAGNVIAALCSFFVPGLGQLVQGRVVAALLWFILGWVLWLVTLGMCGWLIHGAACFEAAVWKGDER